MKLRRPGLLVKILIAMTLGIGAGHVFPDMLSRCFITFNGIFSEFLGFIIPLLIVGFVAPAIADIGRRAGKMLLFTAATGDVRPLLRLSWKPESSTSTNMSVLPVPLPSFLQSAVRNTKQSCLIVSPAPTP